MFNSVSAAGVLIQFCTLALMISGFGFNYIPATVIAVEVAILHNFFWHQRWTFSDRPGNSRNCTFSRLVCFHLANGTISLSGNVLLMTLFMENIGLHYLPANGLSIAVCSVLNFFAGDRLVFRKHQIQTNPGVWHMCSKHRKNASQLLILITCFFLFQTSKAESAVLKPETVEAWNDYVKATESHIEQELSSNKGFLNLDFQSKDDVLHERKELLAGDITIKSIDPVEEYGRSMKVPKGKIHHWRGGIFIPGVDLDFVLSRIENPQSADMAQEDVLESRVLERFSDGLRLFLKLQRSKIVTVVYNTEHIIRFKRHDHLSASSTSVATRIVEVERLKENREREKPAGDDHGFLWRLNSYWRYKQTQGGVIVECESLTLSRSVPKLLEYMISPIINRVARESLERTLLSMRERMIRERENGKANYSQTASANN